MLNRAKNRADVRNKVAHWMVVHYGENGRNHGHVLMSPNVADMSRVTERLTVRQVEDFANLCGALAIELSEFGFELAAAEDDAQKADDVGE